MNVRKDKLDIKTHTCRLDNDLCLSWCRSYIYLCWQTNREININPQALNTCADSDVTWISENDYSMTSRVTYMQVGDWLRECGVISCAQVIQSQTHIEQKEASKIICSSKNDPFSFPTVVLLQAASLYPCSCHEPYSSQYFMTHDKSNLSPSTFETCMRPGHRHRQTCPPHYIVYVGIDRWNLRLLHVSAGSSCIMYWPSKMSHYMLDQPLWFLASTSEVVAVLQLMINTMPNWWWIFLLVASI